MKTVFFLFIMFFAVIVASGQRPTPLTTTNFTKPNDPDVEPAYNYDFVPPVAADILTDSINYAPSTDNRYFMSVFGPRHKAVSTSNIGYFDFHKGTDITWEVSHDGTDYTENNPPDLQCMCDGEVYQIYNPGFNEAENTSTGRYVIIKCNETFAGTHNPEWENIHIAYRHIDEVNPDLSQGDPVSKGDLIGSMGATGYTSNVHLHLSVIRRNTGTQVNVHPMRIFDPMGMPHLLTYLKDAEITQLQYSNTEALFRIAMPHNQANLKAVTLSLPDNAYVRTYDFEEISQLPAIERDSNSVVSGLEIFAYPFNRGKDAYCYHWDKHDDGEVTHDYPSSPTNTTDFAPFLSENLLTTPAYVLDVKVTDLPSGYNIEDLKIELIDIYGRGVSANGAVSQGDFAWAMIGDEISDAEERGADASQNPGMVHAAGSDGRDLELVYDYSSKGHQTIGLRFVDIGLPSNAIVTNARLQFRADASADPDNTVLTNLNIKAENDANALIIDEAIHNLTNRDTTSSVVEWQLTDPWFPSEMGPDQKIEVTPLVQEAISRNANSWTTNSPLVFLIDGEGKRKADAYDPEGNSRKNAYIYVEYTTDPNQSPNYAPEVFLTSPADGAEYDNLDPIALQAIAYDPDHGLQKVEFIVNDVFQGEDTSAPFQLDWLPDDYGSYFIVAVATDIDGNSTDSYEHEIEIVNVSQTQVLEIPLGHDHHDVEEHESGTIWKTNQDLELCYDSYTPSGANQAIGNQYVGLRFENVALPANATITAAHIQFTADETHNNATTVTIWGEKEVSPASFSYSAFNVSSRNMTIANSQWVPNAWNTKLEAGVDQQSADISSILQEIIGLQNWQSGEDIVIILHSDDTGRRTAVSHDQSSAMAPKLYIEYSLDPGGNNLIAPMNGGFSTSFSMDLDPEMKVTLSPNPVSTDKELILAIQNEGETKATVSIFNNAGQLMNRASVFFSDATDMTLDMTQYLPGLYWAAVQTKEKLIFKKLVVTGN